MNLEKLISETVDNEQKRKLEYALYLYHRLLEEKNTELLDAYTDVLCELISNKDKGLKVNKSFGENNIYRLFGLYLVANGKTETTAIDYVNRIKGICKQYNININDLYKRRSKYSINDLVGMYSSDGIKSEENIKRHNAPLSALKQFREFMEGNCGTTNFESVDFYLLEEEGFQSFEIMSEHPGVIEITGKECKITFKENRTFTKTIVKTISDLNFKLLMNVFYKYKDILSKSTIPSFLQFPHGGTHSFCYKFNEYSNHSGSASLFESDNVELCERAYAEYHDVLDKIIKQ